MWNDYYKTDDEFVVALTAVMAPIFKRVVDNGLILQIDDPAIRHDWEEARRPPMSDAEYERFIMLRIEALNAALAGIPEDRSGSTSAGAAGPGCTRTSSRSRTSRR